MNRFDPLTEKNLRVSGNHKALRYALEHGITSDVKWVFEPIKELIEEIAICLMIAIILVV